MLRVSLATLRRNASRYVTTVLAVVLGVAFVAGTLVFADTMEASYESKVMGSAESLSVAVHSVDSDGHRDDEPLDTELLHRIEELAEVDRAGGMVSAEAMVLDQEDRPVGAFPPAAVSVGEVTRFDTAEGSLPRPMTRSRCPTPPANTSASNSATP